MRVKLVSSISSEGATASSVRAMIMVMLSLGLLTVPPRFTEIVPPEPGARARARSGSPETEGRPAKWRSRRPTPVPPEPLL